MIIIILFILFLFMLMLSRYLELSKKVDELSDDLDYCFELIESLKNKENKKITNLFEGDTNGN